MYLPPANLKPTEILGGCIAVYENAWKNPLEDIATIERVSSNLNSPKETHFKKGVVIDNDMNTITDFKGRTNQELPLTYAAQANEEFRVINNKFFDLVCAASSEYRNIFDISEDLYWGEGPLLLKYQTGQEYTAHYDGGTITRRTVSPIVYLNDDYEGGEIEFVNQKVKIKPSSGMLILFPANFAFTHIAHPVTEGTKYAIVTWLHDRTQ